MNEIFQGERGKGLKRGWDNFFRSLVFLFIQHTHALSRTCATTRYNYQALSLVLLFSVDSDYPVDLDYSVLTIPVFCFGFGENFPINKIVLRNLQSDHQSTILLHQLYYNVASKLCRVWQKHLIIAELNSVLIYSLRLNQINELDWCQSSRCSQINSQIIHRQVS